MFYTRFFSKIKKHKQKTLSDGAPIQHPYQPCYYSTYLQCREGIAETRKNEEAHNTNQRPPFERFAHRAKAESSPATDAK